LIELGKLKHISVDKEAMIASVSPSTTGQMLNDALSAEGLMFCGGHCPDVGLGGFLLQGGMGWNCRVSAVATSDDFPDR
jgi:FAD/FMN-containing dehydrogenase